MVKNCWPNSSRKEQDVVDKTLANNGSIQQTICKDVICVKTFSNSNFSHYIKKIKTKYNVQGWLLSVPLLLDKRNIPCFMDFEYVKGFLKLLKKVPSMKNNLLYNFFSNNPEIKDIMLTNYMLIKKFFEE